MARGATGLTARRRCAVIAAFLLASAPTVAAATSADVDLALVLALDSSSSVNFDEFYLQTHGLSVAFASPRVATAVADGPLGVIAVAVLEWADADRQAVQFEWRNLRAEDLPGFAAELADMPRLVGYGGTAIGAALAGAGALVESCPCVPLRRVIDVSGDGRTSTGPPSAPVRDLLTSRGITINGLAIVNEEPDLEAHYRAEVIGGPGAFVLRAADYEDFERAIEEKLVREIASEPLVAMLAVHPDPR